jgi:peroxiredoxin Q/BCP
MSKKSRENSSKAATKKTVAKPSARSAAKPAARKVAEPTKKTASKAPAKTAVRTIAKAVKPIAKSVAKVAAKAKPAVKAPKPVPAAKAVKPAPVAKPAAVAKPVKPAKPKVDTAPALAVEGSLAPSFSLPRDGGATVSLADFTGQKMVIFFYPRANTPGCTKEAIDFTRLGRDFKAANTMVLGVSADPLKAQESFRDKHDLTTPLLSDETQSMLKAYGAWGEKSMYGKVFEGVLRTTVLIGSDGRVARIWRGVKVDGHADAVLEQARQI